MAKEKKSFFERLTGTVKVDEDENSELEITEEKSRLLEDEAEGELTVDVYQNTDNIIIKAMAAGVRPEDLDISIARDMVTIRGKREEERSVTEENYFQKELYWGSFSRTILLPQEIDVEESEAVEKHGLIIITLPKLDKTKQSKLRVKSI